MVWIRDMNEVLGEAGMKLLRSKSAPSDRVGKCYHLVGI